MAINRNKFNPLNVFLHTVRRLTDAETYRNRTVFLTVCRKNDYEDRVYTAV